MNEKDFLTICENYMGMNLSALEDDEDEGEEEEEEEPPPCDSVVTTFHKDFHRDKMCPVVQKGYAQVVERYNPDITKAWEKADDIPIASEIQHLNEELRDHNENNGLQPTTGMFPWVDMIGTWRAHLSTPSKEVITNKWNIQMKDRAANLADKQ
jgi:hypothetical protein